ncbi:MAG: nuclear transport factor 2 family protein [Tepidisphaeraceae bacterium]
MDSTFEIGKKLVAYCNAGKNLEAVNALYSPDVESNEVHGMPEFPAQMKGIDAIRKKNQWWLDNHTIHGGETMGPWPHGDRFIVHFRFDVTAKTGPMAGKRMQMDEAGLYTVRDGKIVREEFFYHMG